MIFNCKIKQKFKKFCFQNQTWKLNILNSTLTKKVTDYGIQKLLLKNNYKRNGKHKFKN